MIYDSTLEETMKDANRSLSKTPENVDQKFFLKGIGLAIVALALAVHELAQATKSKSDSNNNVS
ncbi:MAG: hypothetical protein A2430_00595 [Candidatus Liptonbacteria bacterium RIFOXYC1_FULL_36_8]|uniref:Uncharacterized protein n=2 Tax=Candidatus Liptoniibacteriota TaxID=1817909 RepID=A0A1G2CMN1_9BACT|nr:MAG: hypothetical protein A2390_01900 [Candidatus Liptonbacteria bacterium RIFOXYB1_FULL_36_10]OGZ02950.1 MAG: hypothetical protein A2430_00595 [Candidatus Liptonbacteria bacterium RIFOXYC1_FULL_36_8]